MFKQLFPKSRILVSPIGHTTSNPSIFAPINATRFGSSKSPATATNHTADTYKKDDFDPTPPQDSSIFRVDSGTEKALKPHEPTSGQWSRAGANTAEYEHSDNRYSTTEGQPAMRYGGKEELKEPKTSGADEGPEKKSSGGRK